MSVVREFSIDDRPQVLEWAKGHGLDLDFNCLPPNGFINDHFVVLITETNANYCLLDLALSRPEATPVEMFKCGLAVMDECLAYIKAKGFKSVFSYTPRYSIARHLVKHEGFKLKATSHMLKRNL